MHTSPNRPRSAKHLNKYVALTTDELIKETTYELLFVPGSTLSVSASIHSTLSAGTLTDFENFAASNLNIQKKGIFRKKMSLKDVLSWQAEAIR